MDKPSSRELAQWVRKRLRRGYPSGELRNEMEAEGFSPEEIEAAFFESSNKTTRPGNTKNDYPLWLFISVGLLITGLAFKSLGGMKPLSFQFNSFFRVVHWSDYVFLIGLLGTIGGLSYRFLRNRST